MSLMKSVPLGFFVSDLSLMQGISALIRKKSKLAWFSLVYHRHSAFKGPGEAVIETLIKVKRS